MITVVKGIVNLMTPSKCKNVVVEPVMGYLDYIAMARSYGVLKPGRGKIDVCLRNHSAKQITLPSRLLWERSQQQTSFWHCWHQSQHSMRKVRVKPLLGKGNLKVKKNCWTKLT